jgi:integrase
VGAISRDRKVGRAEALRRAMLDVGPVGDMVFLVTEHGKPYTQAGLEGRSAHGLRKAAAVTAAENGATPHELQAIFGWKTLKEAERYTTAANRKDLAMRSPHLLSRADREQKSLTSSAQTPPVRENGRKV